MRPFIAPKDLPMVSSMLGDSTSVLLHYRRRCLLLLLLEWSGQICEGS